jgi:hypothetical protein
MELSIAPNIYLLELGEEGFRLLGEKKNTGTFPISSCLIE